jgi:heme exporter protein C
LCWGILILGIRYAVERRHQKNAAREAMDALESHV